LKITPQIKISPANKLKLKQLLFICIYWIAAIRLTILQNFFGFHGISGELVTTKFISSLQDSLTLATAAGLGFGLITGVGELFVFPKKFYHKPFLILNFYKLIVYLISIIFVSIVTIVSYEIMETDSDFLGIIYHTWDVLTSTGFYSLLSSGLLLSLGINFILSMQNRIGFGNFVPMLLGRYHKPREEQRIFLFIDLKSSSFTAEKLGHIDYSRLIQTCFRELSDIIAEYNGEIYQFVGDEAVITWKTKNRHNYWNAVMLFNKFKETLERKNHIYYHKFGVMPQFKGAVNSGNVMVAEVGGFLKTEIAYHGDVLNTASRMMEFCKPKQTDLLISETVFENIPNDNNSLIFSNIGEIKLRGKNTQLVVYGCEINNNS
jgi:adenylate cyclase